MDTQQRRQWAVEHKLHPDVVDDPRMPGPETTPITLRAWSDQRCEAEGITDPEAQTRRWKTVQRWPQRKEGFPQPAIFDPPRAGRGQAPAIYVKEELDAWAQGLPQGHTKEHNLQRLAALTSPLTLSEIARVLELDVSTVHKARDASLVRLSQGADPEREVPAPVKGARYDPAAWAHFWQSRPGQGRRT